MIGRDGGSCQKLTGIAIATMCRLSAVVGGRNLDRMGRLGATLRKLCDLDARDGLVNYRSVADLNHCIATNLHRLPRDVDIVLGIPRSGMLPASIIALALNAPLADLDGFLSGRTYRSGHTRAEEGSRLVAAAACRRVLVVDDSVHSGNSIAEARRRIEQAGLDAEFLFVAVYTTAAKQRCVDVALEVVPMPRVFQWNVMHHPHLPAYAVDIDGILCRDPTEAENDDGAGYRRFLSEIEPLYRPTRPVGAFVTSRLEKYREPTEAWLARHGIQYGSLHMLDLPDKATRLKLGSHARFKGEVYRAGRYRLFIESEYRQAVEIARIAGKPVLAMDRQVLVTPDGLSAIAMAQTARQAGSRLSRQLRRLRRIHKLPGKLHRLLAS